MESTLFNIILLAGIVASIWGMMYRAKYVKKLENKNKDSGKS